MPTYIGITLGPVVRTLENARRTRELWASSYMLSWLMKKTADKLRKDTSRSFVMPSADSGDKREVYKTYEDRSGDVNFHGAGLFPDRIIFQTPYPDDLTKSREAFVKSLQELAVDVAYKLHTRASRDYVNRVYAYLARYFNAHFVELELAGDQNPILAFTPVLDALELQQHFPARYRHYLDTYLTRASSKKRPSVLAYDAFGEGRSLVNQTMGHIAIDEFIEELNLGEVEAYEETSPVDTSRSESLDEADPLSEIEFGNEEADEETARVEAAKEDKEREKEEDKEVEDLFEQLRTEDRFQGRFHPAHKYVAIVQADGDNVGKIVEQLHEKRDQDSYERFSQALLSYSIAASEKVAEYGGLPVYAGGDDLLFFAPVINRKNAPYNLFALLQELDAAFKKEMGALIDELGITLDPGKKIGMSFGVSIGFYKFPLYESLAAAQRLLFEIAKDTQLHKQKNTIAFEVRKHSGSTFGARLQLGDAHGMTQTYTNLIDHLFEGQNEQVLSSVAYKLRREQPLVDLIGKEKNRVWAYLNNSFNEAIHSEPEQQMYLEEISNLLPAVYSTYPVRDPKADESKKEYAEAMDRPYNQLFGLLRSLQFLIDDQAA